MLRIVIPEEERYDEERDEFIYGEAQELCLEHSLVSLSKWESRWHKSFLFTKEKTDEESLDYIRCMTVAPEDVNPEVYNRITQTNITEIYEYINNPMTATTIRDDHSGKSNREILTAELIYYYMISFNIPVEFQDWHLNRLLTLIRLCSVKNAPAKKRSKADIMRENAKLNAARRAQMNTKG